MPALLARALTSAGLTSLGDLARATGYRPQTLHAVRSGVRRMSVAMAARIAHALHVDTATARALLGLPVVTR